MSLYESSDIDRLHAFQTLLDGSKSATLKVIDLDQLRRTCRAGIPSQPAHLRPLTYSLLLGTLPVEKRLWRRTIREQRERYYGLVEQFMNDVAALPPPSDPPTKIDILIDQICRDVELTCSQIPFLRQRSVHSRGTCLGPPLHGGSSEVREDAESSSSDIEDEDAARRDFRESSSATRRRPKRGKLACSRNMYVRWEAVQAARSKESARASLPALDLSGSPEQGRDSSPASAIPSSLMSPTITLSTDPSDEDTDNPMGETSNFQQRRHPHRPADITLVNPRPILSINTERSASSMFLSSPASLDTHGEILGRSIFSLCRLHPDIPYDHRLIHIAFHLYLAFLGVDADLAIRNVSQSRADRKKLRNSWGAANTNGPYVEEEMFGCLEAIMLRFSSLHENRHIDEYLDRIDRTVSWADPNLAQALTSIGLSPSQPLYAQRWVGSLLTEDIKGYSLLACWDYILADNEDNGANGTLDALTRICATLVLLSRPLVLSTRALVPHPPKPARPGGLWSDYDEPEPEPAAPSLTADDFMRCLQLFRDYPVGRVGTIAAVLQTASDLEAAEVYQIRRSPLPTSLANGEELNKAIESATSAVSRLSNNASHFIATGLSSVTTATQTTTSLLPSWSKLNPIGTGFWGVSGFNQLPDSVTSPTDVAFTPSESIMSASAARRQPPQVSSSYVQPFLDPETAVAAKESLAAKSTGTSSLSRRLTSLVGSMTTAKSLPKSSNVKSAPHEGPKGPRPLLLGGSGRQVSGSSTMTPHTTPRPVSPGEPRTSATPTADLDVKSPVAGFQMVGTRQAASGMPSRLSPVLSPHSPARQLDYGDTQLASRA